MISVKGLTKWYGPRLAVDNISLEVPKGQIVGFLGPNGAGKTTTIRILTCFMPASGGSASINGHDVFTESELVRKSVGYLPEATPLYPEMRVSQQLHYFGQLQGMNRNERNKRIAELMDTCGLSSIISRQIGQLSKGNRQRVGLAQAMLHDPPVLILDEPTAGLDPAQIKEVRNLITHLASRKTILLSTHILPEVEKTCQNVVIIAAGKVVAQGSPEELKSRVRASSRVLVEVKAPAEAVEKAFKAIPQVGRVETHAAGEGWITAAVTAKSPDLDVRELLGDAVMERRWNLREIRPEAASLEEFFIQITAPAA